MQGALRQLFALAEAYPDLKANQNFQQLQNELCDLGSRHRGASSTTPRPNTTPPERVSPAVLFAQAVGFTAQEFFNLDAAERRAASAAPQVKF